MSNIALDLENKSLSISSYNGYSEKKEVYNLENSINENHFNSCWNFFRQGNNHAYTEGNVFYEGECNNTLIISPYKENKLTRVKDAFIVIGKNSVKVFPIKDVPNAINLGKMLLINKKINYNIPQAVFERENLIEKDTNQLKSEIMQKYDIKLKEISMINCGRTKNGVYHLIAENGKEYVLKFRGRNKEKAEFLPQIAKNIPDYFPINFLRKDKSEFTFKLGDELYGLEEFIKNLSPKRKNLEYLSLMGKHVGLLHNYFNDLVKKDKRINKIFDYKKGPISESNLISIYLDLWINESENKNLLSELERIIYKDLNNKMDSFPKKLIHHDLNHSNLVWIGNNPKIIDSETIKNSIRINEFESPLLFGGNMERPHYLKNSLKIFVNSYDKYSETPLSEEEKEYLPLILKYSLLRNFVIRKIRRGIKSENYIYELNTNLNNLK